LALLKNTEKILKKYMNTILSIEFMGNILSKTSRYLV